MWWQVHFCLCFHYRHDSGLPSAPKECLCQIRRRDMDTYREHPAIYTLLEGCTGGDCGSPEETLMPPGRERSGMAFRRKCPWITY